MKIAIALISFADEVFAIHGGKRGYLTADELGEWSRKITEGTLGLTQHEVDLVRENGECLVSSYQNLLDPDTPDDQQDTEWHEGKALIAFADRLQEVLDGK